MDPLERAKRLIAHYLSTFDPNPELPAAAELLVAARETEALEYVAELATANPEDIPLEALWDLVDDGTADAETRAEALRALTVVLVGVEEELDLDLGFDDDEPVLAPNELEEHVARLIATYRSPAHPKLVRRRALEYAANVSRDDFVVSAGHAAFRAEDPEWVQTGVLVVTLTDRDNAADLVEEALQHVDPRVRLEAIEALGRLDRHSDIDRLAEIAFRGDPVERSAAIATLAEIAHEDAGQALFDLSEVLHGDAAEDAHDAWSTWSEEIGVLLDDDFSSVFDDLDDDLEDEPEGNGNGSL